MSHNTVTTHDLPFPVDQLHTDNTEEQEYNREAADTFRQAATLGVLGSLGAHNLRTIPGRHQLGGLMFTARILPMTQKGRGSRARNMLVMVSLTGGDLIDIDVRYLTGGAEHATARDVYIDQLQRALLALDYDGPEIFNPRYWTN